MSERYVAIILAVMLTCIAVYFIMYNKEDIEAYNSCKVEKNKL